MRRYGVIISERVTRRDAPVRYHYMPRFMPRMMLRVLAAPPDCYALRQRARRRGGERYCAFILSRRFTLNVCFEIPRAYVSRQLRYGCHADALSPR